MSCFITYYCLFNEKMLIVLPMRFFELSENVFLLGSLHYMSKKYCKRAAMPAQIIWNGLRFICSLFDSSKRLTVS